MSAEATNWAKDAPCETASEKAILLLIADYVGSDGTCFPGQATLARQACCSEKTVERTLKAFEARGWIVRHARRRRDGSRTSDLIILTLAPHPEHVENTQPDTVSGRAEPTRHPVRANPTSCPILPDTMSGPTTFEPPEETPEEPARAQAGGAIQISQADCDAFWSAYPEAGRVNFARASLPIALGRHAARLGSAKRLVEAARRYAAAIRKQDTKPKALGNWLADPALVDQYAPPPDDGAPGAVPLDDRRWRGFVGYFARHQDWRGPGPKPGQPGCQAPAHVLVEHGFKQSGEAA